MSEMRTEAATLNAEAQNFDRIAQDLGKEKQTVDSTGSSLAGTWQGQAATAATAALVRFDEAVQAQITELNGIVDNLNKAGAQYTKADDEAQQSLSSKMNF